MIGLTVLGVLAVLAMLLGGLLWLRTRFEGRPAAQVAAQIGLTDAIHGELGAAAAPVVRRGVSGGWIVHVALPMDREDLVGRVVAIAHGFFAVREGGGRGLRIVLSRQRTPGLPAVHRVTEAPRRPMAEALARARARRAGAGRVPWI